VAVYLIWRRFYLEDINASSFFINYEWGNSTDQARK
jgi:hypothetical protein